MAADRNRLARVFIWKEGLEPDLEYARRILSRVNAEVAKLAQEDDPPISLFAVGPPWPDDPWSRAILDLQSVATGDGSSWTDTTRYDLAGWQGTDHRTGEHVFVVTAYGRAAVRQYTQDNQLPLQDAALNAGSSPATLQRPTVAQVPYYPQHPTGPLVWPPTAPAQDHTHPGYPYPYNPAAPLISGPLVGASGDIGSVSAAHTALLDSYRPFYPGFGPRIAAGLIDFFFMSLFQLGTIGAILLTGSSSPPESLAAWISTYGLYACLAVLVFSAYHVVQWSIWGQTLGKKLVGIKIVDASGRPPGWSRSLLRMLGYFFSLSLGGWGVVMIALDLRHQGLHDKIAETYVVPEKALVPAPTGLPGYAQDVAEAYSARQTPLPRPNSLPAIGLANVAADIPYSTIQVATPASNTARGQGGQPTGGSPVSGSTAFLDEGNVDASGLLFTSGALPSLGQSTVPNLDNLASGPLLDFATRSTHLNVATSQSGQQASGTLQARTLFKAGLADMEAGVRPSSRGYKVEPGLARAAALSFRQALEFVPGSVVFRYFYAIALRYSEGFEVAIGELRQVLSQDPTHYEAKQQVAYGPRWHDAFAYPAWVSPAPVEVNTPMPASIADLLPPGQQAATKLVLLREGGVKVAAFLSRTPRSMWSTPPSAEMPARLEVNLSRTPYGPVIALYIIVSDSSDNPYIGETFLNPHDPGLPSDDACQLGQNMLGQIARQDRTYLIFADEHSNLLLSRKLVFDSATQVSTTRLLYEVQTLRPQVMDQERFRQAAEWHMAHFSLDQLKRK